MSEDKDTKKTAIGYNAAVRDQLAELDHEMLLADGFDNAIVGWCYTPGPGHRVIYNANKIIETLTERDGMSLEEAWEYFEFNTEGAYVGEKTPIFWRNLPIENS